MPLPATKLGLSPGMLVALGGSAALHGAVLFAIAVAPQTGAPQPHAMEVRLQSPATPGVSVTQNAILPADAPLAPALTETQIAATQADTTEPATTSSNPDDAATYFSNDELDVPPHMLGEVQQIYPARARRAAVEGHVTVALLINERGEVDDVSVVQAQPGGYFEEAALSMLRKQRFSPPIKHNHAVKSRWLTTVRYRLQG